MRPHERVELARRAYLQAIALVRASSTSASWRRALVAARNLKEARRAGDRARAGRGSPPASRPPPDAARTVCGETVLLRAAAAPDARRARWPGLYEELERARALMERSRRLVAQAKALRDSCSQVIETSRRILPTLGPVP